MTLAKLMEIMDKAYPDGAIMNYFEAPEEDFGDTLALFIVREIQDTFSPKATTQEQIGEARRCVGRAMLDLERVEKALEDFGVSVYQESRHGKSLLAPGWEKGKKSKNS